MERSTAFDFAGSLEAAAAIVTAGTAMFSSDMLAGQYAYDAAREQDEGMSRTILAAQLDILAAAGAEFDPSDALDIACEWANEDDSAPKLTASQLADGMGTEADIEDGRAMLALLNDKGIRRIDDLTDAEWLALIDEAQKRIVRIGDNVLRIGAWSVDEHGDPECEVYVNGEYEGMMCWQENSDGEWQLSAEDGGGAASAVAALLGFNSVYKMSRHPGFYDLDCRARALLTGD